MHDGETINELFEQMGHQGLSFFLLQEICAEKLDKKSNESLTKSDCLFSFPTRIVRQKLRLSQKNLELLLDICQTKGQLSYEFSENLLKISMPILLDLLDSDSKKARKTRVEAATKARLDKEKEEEKEQIKNKNLSKTEIESQKLLNIQVWESYKNAYFNRYKVEPVRNAATNSKISQIAKRLGNEAVDVVRFYLSHNDSFYIKSVHAIGLCLKDAESLRTQMVRGKTVTTNDVRNFEKMQNITNLTKAVRDGENF